MTAKLKQNLEKLTKKRHKKFVSEKIAKKLIELNPQSSILNQYQRTIYCSNTIKADSKGMAHTEYCRCSKWCITCSGIRTMKLINGYQKQLDTIGDDMYFVTLTAQSCFSFALQDTIKARNKIWRGITDYARKTKKFADFKGLRTIEITQRPNDMYHYHYHVLIKGEKQAEWLVSEWMKRNDAIKNGSANRKAQHIRKADKNTMVELCKYSTKLDYRTEFKQSEDVFYRRLNFVFEVLEGRQLFIPFGDFKKVKEEIQDEDIHKDISIPDGKFGKIWTWNGEIINWISELGELLLDSEYKPPERVLKKHKKKQKIFQNETTISKTNFTI